jgi:hypothetical protein
VGSSSSRFSPVVILDIGEFHVLDADVLGHGEDFSDLVDVLAEDRHIEHHRESVALHHLRHLQLQVEGAGADQAVGQFAVAGLDR